MKILVAINNLTSPWRVRFARPLNVIRHFLMASKSWNFNLPSVLNDSLPSVFESKVSGAAIYLKKEITNFQIIKNSALLGDLKLPGNR